MSKVSAQAVVTGYSIHMNVCFDPLLKLPESAAREEYGVMPAGVAITRLLASPSPLPACICQASPGGFAVVEAQHQYHGG